MNWNPENEMDELFDDKGFCGLERGDGRFGIYEYRAEICFSVLSAARVEAEESAICVMERLLCEASEYEPEGDLQLLGFTAAMEDDHED